MFDLALSCNPPADFQYVIDANGEVTITHFRGRGPAVVVPYGVKSIGDHAFSGCAALQSITLPESVKSIGDHAFYDCSALQSITLPESVESIGHSAFYDCSALQSITLPESVESIGHSAFYGCSALQSITLSESVKSIGHSTFYGCSALQSMFYCCSALQSITLPEGVESIGNSAFRGRSALQSITLPESVESIGNSAFYGCSALQSITLPESVESIGHSAFYGCSALQSITLPESVESIDNSAFYGCSALQSITIPDSAFSLGKELGVFPLRLTSTAAPRLRATNGVLFSADAKTLLRCPRNKTGAYVVPEGTEVIAESAFAGCESLTSVALPDGLQFIDESAFYGCKSLTSVALPDSLQVIANSAFIACELRFIAFRGKASPFVASGAFPCDGLLFVASTDGQIALPNVDCRRLKLDEIVQTDDGLFADGGKTLLTYLGQSQRVTIPSGVESIGDRAFERCSLQEITFPDELKTIGKNVRLQETVVAASDAANFRVVDGVLFSADGKRLVSALANFNLPKDGAYVVPNGVETIDDGAFVNRRDIQSLTFPSTLRTVGLNAFPQRQIKQLELPDSSVFENWALFSSATLRLTPTETPRLRLLDGVLFTADGKTLLRCPIDKIGVYVVPDGVETIADGAFASCDSLSSVKLPAGLRAIGQNALPPKLTNAESVAKFYRVIDGVQFSFDGKTLQSCPRAKTGDYVVPDGVETIADDAFNGCRSLHKITLADGLKSIGARAFANCSSLQTIVLPSSLQSVGRNAFSGCISLQPFAIPAGLKTIEYNAFEGRFLASTGSISRSRQDDRVRFSADGKTLLSACGLSTYVVPDEVVTIADGAFEGCRSLETITFGAGLRSVGYRAFAGCSSLHTVTFQNNVETIDDWAFADCKALRSFRFPARLQKIGNGAFAGCDSLKSAPLPNDLRSLGARAFRNCRNLTALSLPPGRLTLGDATFCGCFSLNAINLPDNLATIDARAFQDCRSLKSITFPNGLQTIGRKAFVGCEALKTATLPNGLRQLGDRAFQNCRSLTSVVLPDGFHDVAESMFAGCDSLQSRPLASTNADYRLIDGVLFSADGKTLLRCPVGKSGPYLVPRDVETIAENAFLGCRRLTALTLLDGLKTLAPQALGGCSSLRMLTIPRSVESIGRNALPSNELRAVVFLGAPELASQEPTLTPCYIASPDGKIALENSLTLTTEEFIERYNAGLLLDASGQTVLACLEDQRRIVVPNGVKRIAANVFTRCRQLTSITLPNSLQTIERCAFAGCQSLRSINFGAGLQSIGERAFVGCDALKEAKFSQGLQSIGERAFAECKSLRSINFSDGLQSIGAEAFNRCSSLTSVEFPSGLQTIGGGAFADCKVLRAVSFGDGLQSIGASAFFLCSNSLTFYAPRNSVAEKYARANRPVLRVVAPRR